MEFCKNRRTGKYFVHIEDRPDGKVLLVTPLAEIKALDSSLFDELEEQNPDGPLSRGLVNKQQLRRYHKFIEEDSFAILSREMEGLKEFLEALKAGEMEAWDEFVQAVKAARQKMSLRQWDYVIEKISKAMQEDGEVE
jgi:hypothetical protein